MARPPPEDPRVTDLRRYKKAQELAKRRPPPKPARPPAGGFLGSNPRAGLILAIIGGLLLLWLVGPWAMKLL